MRSLFWKIFLGFWLTVILAGFIVWLLAALTRMDDQPILERHLRFASKGLDGYANDALTSLKQHGLRGWQDYQRAIPPQEPHPYILTSDLQPLANHPVPRMVELLARAVIDSGEVRILKRPHRFAIGRPLQLPDGRDAVLILHFRLPRTGPGGRPPRWERRLFGPDHRLGLVVFLTVAGIVCLLLTRSLTGPIGQLRRATRDFAAGRLDTRVGKKLRGKNELARLGADFDRMAEQIETLVTGQQRLLRDISHELRSPLTRLGVALEMARRNAPPETTALLERIDLESGRLNELISQLLTLNRLEQGTGPGQREPLDLAHLVKDVCDDADFEAAPRGIQIDTDLPSRAAVTGQSELLRRALDNLLRNAIRYSPDGGRIETTLRQQGEDWLLQVSDRGPGVEEQHLGQLFEPFFRADDARTPGGGSGLGLAIAARAIQKHGGHIKASNREGGGLQVSLRLPVEGSPSLP